MRNLNILKVHGPFYKGFMFIDYKCGKTLFNRPFCLEQNEWDSHSKTKRGLRLQRPLQHHDHFPGLSQKLACFKAKKNVFYYTNALS